MAGQKLQGQLAAWAEEFKTYSDVLKTPGWRMLEGIILQQREWYSGEIDRVIKERTIPNAYGEMRSVTQGEVVQEVGRLNCHMEEDDILLDIILGKIKRDYRAYNECQAIERRLNAGGMGKKAEVEPPKFQEVK